MKNYVTCECGYKIELPSDAIGTRRSDPWNVVGCPECGCVFDYDDDEVRNKKPKTAAGPTRKGKEGT